MGNEKIRYLSLFSGIGAPEQALTNLGIDYELVGFSEIDKYAIKSYCAIHGVDESLNLGDITKIDISTLPKDIDLITHGSPCQDYSVAGLNKGGDINSGTRSSLMWNTVAIVGYCRPKYVIWENVKNVLSKKHKHNYDKYLNSMESLGYTNHAKVLNAKNYGVPQNRERIFVISIRKDVKKDFSFPLPFDNGIRLKDILDKVVDEKYYISTEKSDKLIEEYKGNLAISYPIRSREFRAQGWKENCPTICARDYKDPKNIIVPIELPCIVASRGRNPINQSDRTVGAHTEQRLEVNAKGVSNTITSVQKDNYVLETNNLKFVGGIGDKDIVGDDKELSRNYPQGNRVYDANGIACSQTANGGGLGGKTGLYMIGLLDMKGSEQIRRVYDTCGMCPTLDTMQGGNRQPKIIEKQNV